ncbi:archaea-specific SMC-related protein [Halorarius halobius]|uniref:archaea-specific SMC-related protein n=1 Tax=Halorarius halobius TaxID=2962671 RepID=UPI0020CE2A4B|nr:archaea-specific SMC-related protein [Halorarius halobius]
MGPSLSSGAPFDVRVRNVGGIDTTSVELRPGVTVLAGRNATNRTSFLQAVMAGLGSERASLKGDADEGRVELDFGAETATRTLSRAGGSVAFGGDPYLSEPTVADLYAFLLENNEARRAVERGDDLRKVVMRPVDTDEIAAEIDRRMTEKRELETEREALDGAAEELASARERLAEIDDELAAKRDRRDAKREALERRRAAVAGDTDGAFEAAVDDLEDARERLEDVRYELSTARESLESAREQRREVVAELDALPDPEDAEAAPEERIERLRSEKRDLEDTLSQLQTLIRVNQETLDGDGKLGELLRGERSTDGGSVTDALAGEAAPAVCWTCGSSVDRSQFEETLAELRELSASLRSERSRLADRLDELTARREERERRRERRDALRSRADELDAEIADREATVERLEAERTELTETVKRLEAEVERLDADGDEELLSLHETVTRLSFEIDRLEDERAEMGADVAELEARVAEQSEVDERLEQVEETLRELRTRVDRLEREAVDAFNAHMGELLELLGYENIERVWIERRGVGESPEAAAEFLLHIVRTTESGTTYEDTVDHLSESEREVTGLVFALAGYLAHDVADRLPVLVMDSLEAIDSARIASLVDYFADHATYVVVALLPEDAQALDDDYHYVTDI